MTPASPAVTIVNRIENNRSGFNIGLHPGADSTRRSKRPGRMVPG
jgi:hypothetical protein